MVFKETEVELADCINKYYGLNGNVYILEALNINPLEQRLEIGFYVGIKDEYRVYFEHFTKRLKTLGIKYVDKTLTGIAGIGHYNTEVISIDIKYYNLLEKLKFMFQLEEKCSLKIK
jgi:hypothetical protein